MAYEDLLSMKACLEASGKKLPESIGQDLSPWQVRLTMAKSLKEIDHKEEAYSLLHEIYEERAFRFDKEVYGTYEDYIVEKVFFLIELATLSLAVTQEPEIGIRYLDDALDLIDGVESIRPYINLKDLLILRKRFMSMKVI